MPVPGGAALPATSRIVGRDGLGVAATGGARDRDVTRITGLGDWSCGAVEATREE